VASIEADRFLAVRAIAKQYGGICLLKGAGTLISDGEQVVINNSGNAGMASGGMGDVLSGIISALVMQSDNNFYSTCLAAYIHGASADIIANKNGQRGLLASDLFIPLQQLLNGKVPNH
jgi:NAD(P)H-hydrate epimerase